MDPIVILGGGLAGLSAAYFCPRRWRLIEKTERVGGLAKTEEIDGFLDAMLDPAYQRIIVIDAPAVLGVSRFTELDERHAFEPFLDVVKAAELRTKEPEVLSRLIFGMLTRAGMLITASPQPRKTRNSAATVMHELIEAFVGETAA